MIITKKQQEALVNKYVKEHTTDECIGFIDGLNTALDLVKKLTIPVVGSLDSIEKDRLAGIKLNEMRANAVETSILFEVSSKILRRLIIGGIDIGLNHR